MKREEWEFEYTAATLATAAAAQRDFRAGRTKVWEGKKAEVMTKIKDTGLTVHEGIAAGLNLASNKYSTQAYNQGATVMVDATLQSDLNECVSKIQEHENLRKKYDAWSQVLSANPEARVKLDHDDWMFFFGK